MRPQVNITLFLVAYFQMITPWYVDTLLIKRVFHFTWYNRFDKSVMEKFVSPLNHFTNQINQDLNKLDTS